MSKKSGVNNSLVRPIAAMRGIAVLSVIAYHFGIPGVRNGFLGVDIFFVISGYVISRIIYKAVQAGNFRFRDFYIRRAKRLIPAAVIVFSVTSMVSLYLFTPIDLVSLSKSLKYISVFGGNFYFWHNINYFTQNDTFPLLHTWSLGVEEQFYFIFPGVMILLFKKQPKHSTNRSLLVIGILTAASAILGIAIRTRHPMASFYLLPTRAFELLLGTFVFLLVSQFPKLVLPTWLGLSGAVLLIYCLSISPTISIFPSRLSILVVAASAILLFDAEEQSFLNSLLSHRLLVWVGEISYALYLWHYPIYKIWIYKNSHTSRWLEIGILLAITVVLAAITTKFLENPIRFNSKFGAKVAVALIVTHIFLLLGISTALNSTAQHKLNSQQSFADVLQFKKFDYANLMRKNVCFIEDGFKFESYSKVCDPNSAVRDSTILMGDSHAGAISYGLIKAGVNLGQYTYSGCPPLFDHNQLGALYRPYCLATNNYGFSKISAIKPKRVLLLANWYLYPEIDFNDKLSKTISHIHSLSPSSIVYVLGGLPQWHPDLPTILYQKKIMPDPSNYLFNAEYGNISNIDSKLKSIAENNNARFVSILNLACKSQSCEVYATGINGKAEPMAFDYGHLGYGGSMAIGKLLAGAIR